jgi:hypothetical protein
MRVLGRKGVEGFKGHVHELACPRLLLGGNETNAEVELPYKHTAGAHG